MRTLAIAPLIVLVGCGDASELEPTAGTRTESLITNSYATADATVRDGSYASFPQGALPTLEVKTAFDLGWTRISYLRFDIADMPSTGGSATLYLYGTFVGSGEPVRARACAVGDTTWTERTLTWSNAPAIDRVAVAIALVSGEPRWYTLDLTTHVRAQRAAGATQIDLALENDQSSKALARFNSRESPFNPPFLALSTENDNTAPTVATPAFATPPVVDRDWTNLRVLGADDQGEVNLSYTWQTLGTAPGPVQYTSGNGNNLVKDTFAHFSAAGTYHFRVTIADTQGLSTTSDVTVTVQQILRSVTVEPQAATLHPGQTLQLFATARDQFRNPLTPQPTIDWAADYNGSVTPSGLYTAGPELGGPFSVVARTGYYGAGAQITIVP
ncbi:MAG: DNRLRE domain-containing protein [Myxococcales bacterium]|nr:MAG: DNRLRE domain-containing protein [Myxococcales bacterium]